MEEEKEAVARMFWSHWFQPDPHTHIPDIATPQLRGDIFVTLRAFCKLGLPIRHVLPNEPPKKRTLRALGGAHIKRS